MASISACTALEVPKGSQKDKLILAFPKSLGKKETVQKMLQNNAGAAVLEYASFPTVRAVLAYLKEG